MPCRQRVCARRARGRTDDRRHGRSVEEVRRAYELDPLSFLTRDARPLVLSLAGEADLALAAATTAFAVIGRSPWVLMGVISAYVQRKEPTLGEAVNAELQAVHSRIGCRTCLSRLLSISLGGDDAIADAIASVERCDNTGPFWTRTPFLSAAFRAHPRCPEPLRAMGL